MDNYKEPRKHSNPRIKNTLATISPTEKAKTVNKMLVSARLSDLILAKNWSKSEFAARVNQEPSVITKWLSGTHNFTMDTLTEISEALSLPLAILISPKEVQVIYKSKIEIISKNISSSEKERKPWELSENCDLTLHLGNYLSGPFLYQTNAYS